MMDVASEPHELNVYLATNFSVLTQDVADRLTNVLCNSKRIIAIINSPCILYVR